MKNIPLFCAFLIFTLFANAQADVYRGEPISQERKVHSLTLLLHQLVTNEERESNDQEYSQSELNRISYFLHFYRFTSEDFLAVKRTMRATYGLELAGPRWMEVERFLNDFSWIRSRMAYWELAGLRCKYAYFDWLDWRIREEAKIKRGTMNFSSKADEDAFFNSREQSPDKRTVAGLCWEKDKYQD